MLDKDMKDRLVRRGAEVELAELQSRMGVLEKLLGRGPRPGRQGMSAAARKKIGIRMKAYWAAKRKDNKKAPAAKG